ncbi:3-hydroxybutyryl-CoA dehydrogenase Hbd [Anaeromyces robustus]|uniref:3-hydroxybutyryl-CoA dehydrogenase Hbd n=1 Tax=Anaeromyces robustus TaxID=1754192 RepID=A0A1Y1XPP4_9FUNG|nr:3-hydroxybutyryl-CoA dehydrogenase Hbd [Anaeromyces robustus]|eukprot:ORX87701.1 3-hydroxybutyryl-CoA dehydrogenase Hbd [Anaeromyces robustus]
MGFKKVVVLGGGVLGCQIAFQSAYCGFDVSILFRSQSSIERAKPRIEWIRGEMLKSMEQMKTDKNAFCRGFADSNDLTVEQIDELEAKVEKAYKEIKLITSYEEACKDADVIIESIAEDPKQKMEIYQKLQSYLEEKTIIVTNSSSLLPSQLADFTGRPEKFLAFHFANKIWTCNIVEIMAHDRTDPKYFDEMVKFAEEIRMIPLKLSKEQPGYILNSLLIPFLVSALKLWVDDVADVETIDKTWELSTSATLGPFKIMDIINITTVYNVTSMIPNSDKKVLEKLKEMIDNGKMGVISGEGFYKYGKEN